jgi:hypothetical protein
MKRSPGTAGYGIKLFDSFKAGQVSQSDLIERLGALANAVDTAKKAIVEIDVARDREFAAAAARAKGAPALLAKMRAATYQWHTRTRTILGVIAVGKWGEIEGLSYTEMYAKGSLILRPARKRRGTALVVSGRQVVQVERAIAKMDQRQAVEILRAISERLDDLGVKWASTLARDLMAALRRDAPEEITTGSAAALKGHRPLIVTDGPVRRQRTVPALQRLAA